MHLVIPISTVLSFILNDAPIGKPKPQEPFKGLLIIILYAAVMMAFFGSGILPSEKVLSSFLDFENTSLFSNSHVW